MLRDRKVFFCLVDRWRFWGVRNSKPNWEIRRKRSMYAPPFQFFSSERMLHIMLLPETLTTFTYKNQRTKTKQKYKDITYRTQTLVTYNSRRKHDVLSWWSIRSESCLLLGFSLRTCNNFYRFSIGFCFVGCARYHVCTGRWSSLTHACV